MINIDRSALIGKGLHRECYRHPDNENQCIKIVVFGNDQEVNRELKYYRHLENRNIRWDMIPRYHGNVETNLGSGSVFDLVCDYSGDVSKTLVHYFATASETQKHYKSLSIALQQLKNYLLHQHIITMTIKPQNIVYQQNDSQNSRLVLIDNIGNSDFISICNYNKYLARKKIMRKWQRFEDHLHYYYKHNEVLRRMLEAMETTPSGFEIPKLRHFNHL